MAQPILKRGDPARRRDNDVLEDGKVVGRIFHLEAAAPEGRPWMWANGHNSDITRAAHGYEATREEAMVSPACRAGILSKPISGRAFLVHSREKLQEISTEIHAWLQAFHASPG